MVLASTLFGYDLHELRTTDTAGALSFAGSITRISLGVGYNYTIAPPIQVGFLPGFTYTSGNNTSATTLSFLAGPTFNFPGGYSLSNAVFLTGLVGLNHTSLGGISATKFAFAVEAGKRFALLSHFCYRPSFSVIKVLDADTVFAISFLAFAATF